MDEMTNYTNMLRMNEKVCEEKRILAIDTIRRMVRDNEQITICELTKQTGLSRSFFYKNAVVNMELNAALKAQQGKILSSKRDKKLNEALKETVKPYHRCRCLPWMWCTLNQNGGRKASFP